MSFYHHIGTRTKSAAAQNPYQNVNPTPSPGGQDWASAPGVKTPNQGSWLQRNVIDNPWLEGAAGLASFVPVVGGAINAGWQGVRGTYHAAQGNYGKAAEAAAWGAAGLIPGGGAARIAKLGMGGAKALRAGQPIATGLAAARAAAPATGRLATIGRAADRVATPLAVGMTGSAIGGQLPNYGAGGAQAPDARYGAPVNSFSSYADNLMAQGVDSVRAGK
jgi:hypothetical protein